MIFLENDDASKSKFKIFQVIKLCVPITNNNIVLFVFDDNRLGKYGYNYLKIKIIHINLLRFYNLLNFLNSIISILVFLTVPK